MPSNSMLVEACNTIRELKDNYIRILEDSILDKINQIEKNKEELKAVKENLHIAQQIIDMLSEDNGKLDRENEELKLMNEKLKALRPRIINKESNHASGT